ncbi:hypothetical protein AGMMS49928_14640 [Spirochaetia bacterium]|nr:hypothetical protein AGMMS49928_14640 [Spirochaetia bacterium]
MMKKIRPSILPPGWYPADAGRVKAFLEGLPRGLEKKGAAAVIAPHAGWAYSGKIAVCSFRALETAGPPDTVAILGGHLGPGMPPLFAPEDGVQTPLGNLMIDTELRSLLFDDLSGREDRFEDNTVEVLLPMVKYFFPQARLLWLRLPAEISSLRAGELLAEAAAVLGRKIAVVGSTDLTHYGANYGFSPQGGGQKALDWVRQVNDRSFIDAVLAGDAEKLLDRAEKGRAACSAGAVLGALGFARKQNAGSAELLAYSTSADSTSANGTSANGTSAGNEREPPPFFVGYASMAWY